MNDITPKTIAAQKAATAEKHPEFTLEEPPTTPPTKVKPSKRTTTCEATRWRDGGIVRCELKSGHDGHHSESGIEWRRRSGDPRE